MKKEAKVKIKELIDKYEIAVSARKVDNYTEEETKNAFIKPLFEALGWDFSEKDEVSAEENIVSSGRVDYGFYINGRAKFYLEAKKLKADLNVEEFARQAIRYSFNKGITWAVLTDFESIKVFNAQALSNYLGDKQYFEIKYSEYLNRLDQLWLLSKEAFEGDRIDKEAEKAGKKLQKIPVTELLYKDLNECRKILTEYLGKWNPEVAKYLLDEGVQKLLDRLIFIRVAEDRKIEQNILTPLINQWRTNTDKNKPELYESMAQKFRELDDIYNSNLFTPHPFEKWEDDGGALEKVIKILHGKQGYYEYDFSVMPADVLGSVYENYLGHKLSQSKKGLTLDKTANKRKEQGIYYTPTFIVDYIARNALKPVLDKCKSINDLKKIKVLDPACGSGSFLIKALEVIAEKYKDFNLRIDEYTKIQIILDNLYGVDLDMQAVEIARLNLLINTLEEKGKLPSLDKNIKNGNSLISGTDEELQKYFGKNFRDKKPFNWQEEFPEVFKQGGFDVIIGNPPWVSLKGKHKSLDFSDRELQYFYDKLNANTYAPNLYEIFIWKSIHILKDKGILSFIVPDRLFSNEQFINLRKNILENMKVRNLLFNVDFPGIIADTAVFVIENVKTQNESIQVEDSRSNYSGKIPQKLYLSNLGYNFIFIKPELLAIFKRILSNPKIILLSKFADSTSGCGAKSNLLNKQQRLKNEVKVVKGMNVERYYVNGYFWFDFKDENLTGRTKDKEKLGTKEKILLRKTGDSLIASFDDSGIFPEQSLYFIFNTKTKRLLYLLAILNSKLMDLYYQTFAITNKHSTPQLKNVDLDKFPILDPNSVELDMLVSLSNKQLNLQKDIHKIQANSNKWNSIKSEIEKTDKKIDEEVYKLYGLTSDEIGIIENNYE